MAAPAGKKGKKKGKTLSINEFLGGSAHAPGDGTSFVTVPKHVKDWSEDVPDDANDDSVYSATRVALPTAPRASRDNVVDLSQVPERGPFTAFVGNLSYDVDEDVLSEFFSKLDVVNVRLPKENGRLRGFGYVEFSTRQGLIDALGMNDEELMNRNLRINLVGSSNQDGRDTGRRGFGPRREEDDYDRPSETDNNWRAGPAAPLPERRHEGGERSRGFGDSYRRNYEDGKGAPRSDGADGPGWRSGAEPRGDDEGPRRESDDGPRRGFDDGPRRGFDDGPRRGFDDGPRRGFDDGPRRGFDDGPRRGFDDGPRRGFDDGPRRGFDDGPRRGYDDGPRRGYDDGPRRGYDDGPRRGFDDGPRRGFDDGPRRGFDDGPRRGYDDGPRRGYDDGPRRGYDDGPRRGYDDGPRRGYDDGPRRGYDDGPRRGNDDLPREETKERPKLQLQPRTKAKEEVGQPSVSSSVFGAAKPVDTAAREREVEEKLEKLRSEPHSRSRGFERSEKGWASGASDSDHASTVPAAGLPKRRNDDNIESSSTRHAGSTRTEGGGADRPSKGKWEKPLPTSVDEMPKQEPAKEKDFSDRNKFSGLRDDSSGEEAVE